MSPIRFFENKKDSLLLSFEEAKVSCVDFDNKSNDLKTVSLHYMEDEFLKEGCVVFNSQPILKVDKRCCAVLFYDYKLCIIPFRHQEDYDLDVSSIKDKKSDVPVQQQIIIDLKELGFQNIKDYCFLYGYNEPTLLILHETEKTCSSRIYLKRNTCTLSAISLDLNRKHYPIIWSVKSLPHSCYQLIPLKDPIGGALVVGFETVLHVNQKITYGLSFNDFSKIEETNLPIPLEKTHDVLIMDGFHLQIAPNRILFSIQEDLWVLNIHFDKVIKKLSLQNIGKGVETSCMCLLNDNLIFFGSKQGDSKLMELQEKRLTEVELPQPKKTKFEDDYLAQLDEEEQETSIPVIDTKYEFKLVDTITSIGPVSSFIVSETPGEGKDKLEIVTCSGYGNEGSLSVLRKNIKPNINNQTKYDAKINSIFNIQNELLVFGLEQNSKFFKIGKGLDELTESNDFITNETTLNMGTIKNYLFQITKDKIRVYSKFKLLDSVNINIDYSFISDSYILIIYDGYITLFEIKENKLVKSEPTFAKVFGKILAATIYQNYLLVCWTSGCFEIYDIQNSFKTIFTNLLFSSLLSLLDDINPSNEEIDEFISLNSVSISIKEILLKDIDDSQFLLIILGNGSLVAYKMFQYKAERSSIRFSKIPLESLKGFSKFVSFNNIKGLKGCFITGSSPAFLVTEKGYLRVHYLKEDILSFSEFNNINVKNGFIYYSNGLLNFATLDENTNYGFYWPVKKIPIYSTPHHVVYHSLKQYYCISTSEITEVPEQDLEEKIVGRFPIPTESKYDIRLLNSRTFNLMSKIELEPHEHVTNMKICHITKEEENIRKEYVPLLVVTTTFIQNEDVSCRGRIYLFDTHLQDKNTLAFNKLSMKELKGAPCTSLVELDGYVAVSAGAKIYVYYYDWENKQFVHVSFFDAQFYCTSMMSIKRYLVFGDRYRSIYFLNWKKEQGRALELLARDYNMVQVMSTGFISFQGELGMITSDCNHNIQIFGFQKGMIVYADFNVGGIIKDFVRLKMNDKKDNQLAIFAQTDGAISCVIPIDELTHRRFNALENRMYTQLNHSAGLHPKSFRLFKPEANSLHLSKKNIIDGQLIKKFQSLNLKTKNELSKHIGYNHEDFSAIISKLENTVNFF